MELNRNFKFIDSSVDSNLDIARLLVNSLNREAVLVVSPELNPHAILDHLASLVSHIPYETIVSGTLSDEDLNKLARTTRFLQKQPIKFSQDSGESISQLVEQSLTTTSGNVVQTIYVDMAGNCGQLF